MYEKGISHGDISLSNCLINTQGQITFIDYGLSKRIGPEFNELDEKAKLLFIINSCTVPNFVNYKWFYTKKYYVPTQVEIEDYTKITMDEIEDVVVAHPDSIIPFTHPYPNDFKTGIVRSTIELNLK
jgi:serine/threonine protein kinase